MTRGEKHFNYRLYLCIMTSHIRELAEAIKSSERMAALTGAGISVASGIPDFRSKDGLWTTYDPSVYASFQRFIQDPSYFWEMHIDVIHLLRAAEPNPAHKALVALENQGKLQGVITQNIDGLHQRAGSKTVYELHGTNETCSCTICGKKYETNPIADHLISFEKEELINLMRKGKEIPTCGCGGWIKPDVILFGEMMPAKPLRAAETLVNSCDFLLVVGTSLQVQPAASIPFVAKKTGSIVGIINNEPGPLDRIADCVVIGNAEEVLPHLLKLL